MALMTKAGSRVMGKAVDRTLAEARREPEPHEHAFVWTCAMCGETHRRVIVADPLDAPVVSLEERAEEDSGAFGPGGRRTFKARVYTLTLHPVMDLSCPERVERLEDLILDLEDAIRWRKLPHTKRCRKQRSERGECSCYRMPLKVVLSIWGVRL